MKKIFLIFISFLLSSLVFIQASASDVTAQNKLFKELALSTTQVENDYSKKYTSTLDLYFNKIRYYKKRNELLILEKKLEPVISRYNKKTFPVCRSPSFNRHRIIKNKITAIARLPKHSYKKTG